MRITPCTPSSDYRGPVRVSHSEYGWDLEEMVGCEADIVVLATGERVERRWVLIEGHHLRGHKCPSDTPTCPAIGRPWRIGDRVVVVAQNAPSCRSGAIVRIDNERGGVLVRHDWPEVACALFSAQDVYGWAWSEIEPEAQ